MPRRRSGGLLLPWLSARLDGKEGRFVQIGNSLLLDKRFQALSAGARQLYICIALESGGKQEVEFPHGAARKYGFASTSFDRYVKELQNHGFLEKVGAGNFWQYAPSVFRFSVSWKLDPAPHLGDT